MSSNSDDDFEPPETIDIADIATRVSDPTAPFVLGLGTREGTFDDVVQATFSLCNQLGKFHKVHKRDKIRLIMVCGTETTNEAGACPFYVAARCDDIGFVRVHRLNVCHTCGVSSSRKRNVKTSLLSSASPTISAFVTSSARRGGNAAQLKEQCKKIDGFDIKSGQLHRIIAQKKSTTGDHLAQYRYLESLFLHLNAKDPGGSYELKFEWCASLNSKRLVSFFVAPSATKRNHKRFEPVAAVDCAHLTSITGRFSLFFRAPVIFCTCNRCFRIDCCATGVSCLDHFFSLAPVELPFVDITFIKFQPLL